MQRALPPTPAYFFFATESTPIFHALHRHPDTPLHLLTGRTSFPAPGLRPPSPPWKATLSESRVEGLGGWWGNGILARLSLLGVSNIEGAWRRG